MLIGLQHANYAPIHIHLCSLIKDDKLSESLSKQDILVQNMYIYIVYGESEENKNINIETNTN